MWTNRLIALLLLPFGLLAMFRGWRLLQAPDASDWIGVALLLIAFGAYITIGLSAYAVTQGRRRKAKHGYTPDETMLQ